MTAGSSASPVLTKSDIQRAILFACIGSCVFGSVALFTNWGHSWDKVFSAVAAQMGACIIMTMSSTSLMQASFRIVKHPFLKFMAASWGVGMLMLVAMTTVHILSGTPEVFKTVGYATILGVPYYFFFPLHLLFEHYAEVDAGFRTRTDWRRNWGVRVFPLTYNAKETFAMLMRYLTQRSLPRTSFPQSLSPTFYLGKNIPDPPTMTVAFLGDILPIAHKHWVVDDALKAQLQQADYLVLNLEGSLGQGPYSIGNKQHSLTILDDFSKLFPPHKTAISLANNHAADFDFDQLQSTVEALKKKRFLVFGTRDEPALLLENSINLIGATQWTNQQHGYLTFLENAHKHTKADRCNILFTHWGYPLESQPRQGWSDLAHQLSEDFDAIVGHHSHVPGPIQCIKDSQDREKLVAYSLGNACSDSRRKDYRQGTLLILGFHHENNLARCSQGAWSMIGMEPSENTVTLHEIHQPSH